MTGSDATQQAGECPVMDRQSDPDACKRILAVVGEHFAAGRVDAASRYVTTLRKAGMTDDGGQADSGVVLCAACSEEPVDECAGCCRPICDDHARRGPSGDLFCAPDCPPAER
jgi:hypothetical protein